MGGITTVFRNSRRRSRSEVDRHELQSKVVSVYHWTFAISIMMSFIAAATGKLKFHSICRGLSEITPTGRECPADRPTLNPQSPRRTRDPDV
jgi:hypothetical protein